MEGRCKEIQFTKGYGYLFRDNFDFVKNKFF